MAKLKAPTLQKTEQEIVPRWKKILALPESVVLRDISTGKKYKVGQFVPIYTDTLRSKVDMLGIWSSKQTEKDGSITYTEQVYVPFLRLLEDEVKCSLNKPTKS